VNFALLWWRKVDGRKVKEKTPGFSLGSFRELG